MTKRKAESEKQKVGRPCTFNADVANKICELVATSTIGLRKLCNMHDELPTHETVLQWRHKFKEFSAQYDEAKRSQADLLAEEIVDIADDGNNDYIETPEGFKLNTEHIQRSRLRVDARKWIACKLLPKVYGDRVQNETTHIIHENTLEHLK